MTVGYVAMQTNLEIKAKGNVIKKATAGSDLVDKAGVVTSGDGLYADSYESNVYMYRGANPNNYVTFNGETWRIISANTSDNTIKIIKDTSIGIMPYDTSTNNRSEINNYCASSSGCNIWGGFNTLYDTNMNIISNLAREVDGTKYRLPSKDAEINIYLNNTYYNSLNITAQDMVIDGMYKVGVVKESTSQKIRTDIDQASAVKWKGKIGLIDITEFVRASTNNNCDGVYSYINGNCSTMLLQGAFWLLYNQWTLSPASSESSEEVYAIDTSVKVISSPSVYYVDEFFNQFPVYPVLYLSPEVQITGGMGTETEPYELTI